MLLIPYRSHKSPESFPYATVALIALNVVVYVLTTENFLAIRPSVLEGWALSHNTLFSQPWRILSAMFLHGSLSHLIGNMIILGVFGPAAEGRLRTQRFALLYFLAGIIGGLFDDLVSGFGSPGRFSLGASGAIMGVVGMYLYMFPHSGVSIFYLAGIKPKTLHWKAHWIIGFYLFFDIWYGMTQAQDGVGHLCHLGGIAVGWVGSMLLGAGYDSSETAKVDALLAKSGGNLYTLLLAELAFAYESCPNSIEVAMAYCLRSAREGARRKAVEIMYQREALLAEGDSPEELAYIILSLNDYDGNPPLWLMLRIAIRLSESEPGLAEPLLWRVLRNRPRPTGDILEKALMQLAVLLDAKGEKQKEEAAAMYLAVAQQFPVHDSAMTARLRIKELGYPERASFSLLEGKIIYLEARKTVPAPQSAPTAISIPVPEPATASAT